MFFPLFSNIERMCHCLSVLVVIMHMQIILLDHIYIIMYTHQIKLISVSNFTRILWHTNTHNTIPQNSENSTTQFIKKTPSPSFVMSSVTEAEVRSLFSSLDVQKASLDIIIANKLIKIAAEMPSKPLAYNYIQPVYGNHHSI